jgi:sugar phosphate isomerase/epimerase
MQKIAISNIAWTADEDEDVAQLLADRSVGAIEVAPGRLFSDPLEAPDAEVAEVRKFWGDYGIDLVAMQALLYGHPEFSIFSEGTECEAITEYLKRVIDLAGRLGCGPLVFGSPKNRHRGSMDLEEAYDRAAAFFRPLAAAADSAGCIIAIEPNATDYECDFINRVGEAVELVRRADCRGIMVNLDAGVFEMENDDLDGLRDRAPHICHFHASRPFLQPFTDGSATVTSLKTVMFGAGYDGYVSIEMRPSEDGGNLPNIAKSIDRLRHDLVASC